MAYVNTSNYEQEMVERDPDPSTYTSLTQRREDEATYSEIRPSEIIQSTNDNPREDSMCSSKIKLGFIIVVILALAALSSSIVATVILKQVRL